MKIISRALLGAAALVAAAPTAQAQAVQSPESRATPEDVQMLHRFSACVAERYPSEARRMLGLDFRTRASSEARRELALQGRGCIRDTAMGMSGVVFAGAVAEALIERERGLSFADRLRTATGAPVTARAPSEATAFCIARAAPHQLAALMGTNPGGPEELAWFEAMRPQLATCGAGDRRLNAHVTRAMLVLGAYQLLSAARGQQSAVSGGTQ